MQKMKLMYIAKIGGGAHGSALMAPGSASGKCSISSYDDLEPFLKEYQDQIAPDAWVIDGRGCENKAMVEEAINGPMVDPLLEKDEGTGPFQYVTPKTKADRWKAIGAKVVQFKDWPIAEAV